MELLLADGYSRRNRWLRRRPLQQANQSEADAPSGCDCGIFDRRIFLLARIRAKVAVSDSRTATRRMSSRCKYWLGFRQLSLTARLPPLPPPPPLQPPQPLTGGCPG